MMSTLLIHLSYGINTQVVQYYYRSHNTHISHILPICHVCHCRHMYSSNGGFFYSCGSVVPGLTKFRPGATDMQLRFLLEFFFVFVFFLFVPNSKDNAGASTSIAII